MPSTGSVAIPFVLTSVNGFVGQLVVSCTPPTVATNVRLPYIEAGGPAIAYNLVANGTASGSITLLAKELNVVAARLNLPAHPRHNQRAVWSLAGAFLIGIGLRRRKAWAARLSLAVCLLIALTTISACGSGPTLTPGTYTYTLTATQTDITLPPSTSTTATVTVPPGIPTSN